MVTPMAVQLQMVWHCGSDSEIDATHGPGPLAHNWAFVGYRQLVSTDNLYLQTDTSCTVDTVYGTTVTHGGGTIQIICNWFGFNKPMQHP